MNVKLESRGRDVPVVATVAALRARIADWRQSEAKIALVPTMGALHEGHLTLVRRARRLADRVVVSIFVNPIQFGPNEDYAAYPRREQEDKGLLAKEGADIVFAPTVQEMYPNGFATNVHVAGLTEGLCGAVRPGHFDGVATVVTKLLLQARPDIALFGEKDYQQLLVIRRAAIDLDSGVSIIGVPIVRDFDGLALSSRNAYLSAEDRRTAPALYRILTDTAHRIEQSGDIAVEEERAKRDLRDAGFASVDYVELRDAHSLARPAKLANPSRLLAAVRLGRARLIDNVPVTPVA